MQDILNLSWRGLPCAGLVLAALAALMTSRGWFAEARAAQVDPARAACLARGIRLAIAAACLFSLALGWWLALEWLVVLALVVLGEDMLETSVMVAALGGDTRRRGADLSRP